MRTLPPVLATALSMALPLALLAPAAPAATASTTTDAPSSATASAAPPTASRALPRLRVRTVVRGLDNPWDVKVLPDGALLMTERDRARVSVFDDGALTSLAFPGRRVWVSGETGLMSLEVDPRFRHNRRFYTCSGWNTDGGHDVRVNAWRLNPARTRARLVGPLLKGMPTTSGRHGGCRLLIADDGSLVVGTGDAAVGSNPRDLTSLGGKTLRLNRFSGRPWRANPFREARNRHQRYVLTYGHRNVQGLAQRRNGTLWSVEHGSYRDDEVNLLRAGGDYGWNPVPGYDESVPMTDTSLPGRQRAAKWSSGDPTVATSGAAWVKGKRWGRLNGTLAVAALKAGRVIFMKFDRGGSLRWTRAPRALRDLGRLRSVTPTPRRTLLLTTDNDGGTDQVLRVAPRRR